MKYNKTINQGVLDRYDIPAQYREYLLEKYSQLHKQIYQQLFDGKDRIQLNYTIIDKEFVNNILHNLKSESIISEVQDILEQRGYKIDQNNFMFAYHEKNPKNKLKVGRILFKLGYSEYLDKYSRYIADNLVLETYSDPQNNLKIILSRKFQDIITMSHHRR